MEEMTSTAPQAKENPGTVRWIRYQCPGCGAIESRPLGLNRPGKPVRGDELVDFVLCAACERQRLGLDPLPVAPPAVTKLPSPIRNRPDLAPFVEPELRNCGLDLRRVYTPDF